MRVGRILLFFEGRAEIARVCSVQALDYKKGICQPTTVLLIK